MYKTMCYIEVFNDGTIDQFSHIRKSDLDDLLKTCRRVENDESKLYVAWQRQWRTDLFIVDTIQSFKMVILNKLL